MRRLVILALLLSTAGASRAADGTTAASSLLIGVGARGQALGDAYASMATDVEALFWNPAGLASGAQRSLLLGFQPMLGEATMGQAAVAARFGRAGFGAAFNGLQHKDLDLYDDVGNRTGSFKAGEQTILAGAAFGGPGFSLGLAGKFWSSEIDGRSASVAAADIGAAFGSPFSGRVRHALVVRHLGGKVSFVEQEDPLPTSVVFGSSYRANRRLSLALDAGWERDADAALSAGVEWAALKTASTGVAFRGGYGNRRSDIEGLSGVSLGFGVGLRTLSFDYAWVPFGDLGDSHVVSLIWRPSPEPLELKRRGSRAAPAPAATPAKGKIDSKTSGRKQLDDLGPNRRK